MSETRFIKNRYLNQYKLSQLKKCTHQDFPYMCIDVDCYERYDGQFTVCPNPHNEKICNAVESAFINQYYTKKISYSIFKFDFNDQSNWNS